MNHLHIASTAHCSTCGKAVDGYMCPGCKKTFDTFDPDHFRKCPKGEKLKLKCVVCNQTETNCTC